MLNHTVNHVEEGKVHDNRWIFFKKNKNKNYSLVWKFAI